MRSKAMRRTLRLSLGGRTSRRANTKITDGSKSKGKQGLHRKRAQKPSARVSALEQFVNWPPDDADVTIQ